ncbi:LysR family transcriptional regulator [Novosphingobium sp. FSY-8]|uniref:LysR family transcriptional regulator n=1 Tax=Novosphingobium ovatum TaxID=1908523 RepID=A0ABW9XGX1_9SPHN|nr:LysR substrate-binding domain-containing protein [Novosphingobium ovatum]NBC37799.1 LysR family transcriptional regulator [Novosphingobium ovatum]
MRRIPSLAALRQFRLLAQTSSFSRAAELAHVTQPALSRTVRLLEEELNARLFDRDRRRVTITPAGEALLRLTERLLDDAEDAFGELGQVLAGARGRVALGVLPSFAVGGLPAILRGYCDAWPGVDVAVHEGLAGALFERLRDRQVDIAVTTPPDAGVETFAFQPLCDDPCALVCRRGEAPDQPSWHSFLEAPFIAMAPHSSVRQLTDAAFARAGIAPRPMYACAQPATVGAFVAAGLGFSALPLSTRPMVAGHDLEWHLLDDPQARRVIGVARLAGRTLSPAARNLWAALIKDKG